MLRQAAVEFNVTEHCNLRCAGCDHASPLLPRKFASVPNFEKDVNALARVLRVGELKFVGGEPLLHPELNEFLRVARATAFADTITLYTNGVLLHRIDPNVWDSIDKLYISIYPGVSLGLPIVEIERLSVRCGFELELWHAETFRATLLGSRNEDESLVRRIYRDCALAHRWSCHTIHGLSFTLCGCL